MTRWWKIHTNYAAYKKYSTGSRKIQTVLLRLRSSRNHCDKNGIHLIEHENTCSNLHVYKYSVHLSVKDIW